MIQWPDMITGQGGTLAGYATSTSTNFIRISKFFNKTYGYSMFGLDGAATVDDIMQGSIGNCWFMAACSAVAETPGRIEKMFGGVDQFNNNAGFYDVKFYLLSVPITIRIDDLIPTYGTYSQTLFARIVNKGVWMPVVEKAFAKMYGNY
jgi:hypothetical protein